MENYRPGTAMQSAVKTLIIINVAVFFLSMFVFRKFNIDLADIFGMHIIQSEQWGFWQYITHMFMHGGYAYSFSISHLFFNMFALYMFGKILEQIWGTKRFLIYYFATGIGAALLNNIVNWFQIQDLISSYEAFQNTPTPDVLAKFISNNIGEARDWVYNFLDAWQKDINNSAYISQAETIYKQAISLRINTPTIGASGAIFGILLAFGMYFPNTELYIMFIPVPIKAKYFVVGYGVLELLLGFQHIAGDNVAHFAHLGGMIVGYIIIKLWQKNRKSFY